MVTRTIMKMIIIRIIKLNQQHQKISSSFQPIKKKKILPSSSSSGGGGSIPCGRGPLGSYLDGMESARDTASDDTDDADGEWWGCKRRRPPCSCRCTRSNNIRLRWVPSRCRIWERIYQHPHHHHHHHRIWTWPTQTFYLQDDARDGYS